MRKIRAAVLATALTASLIASQGTAAAGSAGKARGKVTATIGGVSYLFSFNAGGSKKGATGGYIVTAPNGDYVSGRVECYSQTGNTAVFAGPIIEDDLPAFGSANGNYIVISVIDGSPDQIAIDNSTSCAPNSPLVYADVTGDITLG